MPWISRRELDYLYSEIDRLRSLVERERKRADRAVDQVLTVHGTLPVGDEAIAERKDAKQKVTEAIAGLGELLAEETAHLHPNGSETPIPSEPVVTD